MPRLSGVKERRHQPLYDTLVRSNAVTTIAATTSLFGNANVGQPALTNINAPGQLASDQTYVVLAMRCLLYFEDTNATSGYGTAQAVYQAVSQQLFFTFVLGEKPQFSCPAWYLPAGGGTWTGGAYSRAIASGAQATATAATYCNGEPSQDAILKLARPIMVPVRQSISVQAQFNAFSGSISAATTGLGLLNAHTGSGAFGVKVVQYFLDGLQTREVL